MTHSQSKAMTLEKKAYFGGIFKKLFYASTYQSVTSAFKRGRIVQGYTIFIFSTFFAAANRPLGIVLGIYIPRDTTKVKWYELKQIVKICKSLKLKKYRKL